MVLFALPLGQPLVASGLGALSLAIDRVEHPAFAVRDLKIQFPPGGSASVGMGRLRIGEHQWRNLQLVCARGSLDAAVLRCEQGRLRVAGAASPLRIDFRLDLSDRSGELTVLARDGARVQVRLLPNGAVEADVRRFDLATLKTWLPALEAWSVLGRFDGKLSWQPERSVTLSGRLDGAGFGSSDGLRAAEQLVVDVGVEALWRAGGWDWSASSMWREGAAYLHPFYIEAGPQLVARGRLQGNGLDIVEASIRLEGVEQLAASATVDTANGLVERAAVALAGADLAVVGPRWLSPVLAPAATERLQFAGHVSGALEFAQGRLLALDAVFDQAGFSLRGADGGTGVAFGPLSGHVPWRESGATRAELSVGGGRWQKLALGAFEFAADIEGERVQAERIRIPLLDGAVVVDGLVLNRGEGGWRGSASLVIEPLSMRLLTDAVGLPSMSGVLSASMPGVRVSPGEVALDGALVISVFDGYLQATGLRLQEPFGVASHLVADIEARHIDLAQLTDTFSFGNISGFVDADVRGLELARWRPERFDARVVSSAGRYPRRISQRAVQNISALGGPGAVAAIQRSLLGFFDTFGYREIGFGCALRSGVCVMSGIDDGTTEGGFVIVRGGGIPALDVIGYNRRVDWRELIERLQRVIAGNVAPEVR